MTRTIGLILAGGRARRMGGRDKTFVTLAGRPLLAHVIARLAPQVDALAVNSNADPRQFADFGLPVLPDVLGGFRGPLAGVHAGLLAYPDARLVTVAVDLPFLPTDLVARLAAGWDGRRCRYARQDGRHALALLWPPGLAPALAEYLAAGHASLRGWLAEHGEAVEFVPGAAADLALNLNTPEELAAAERRLAAG
jgi:molybdopterin-guanine dinucleotide biosynthesis protein A